jgi:hypothetical protein
VTFALDSDYDPLAGVVERPLYEQQLFPLHMQVVTIP